MHPVTSCPTIQDLRMLLYGALSDEQQATLSDHLDECTTCQHRIESLATGSTALADAARQAGDEPPRQESALFHAINDLKLHGGAEDWGEETAEHEESPLHFLTPSENPDHMGKLGNYEITQFLGRGGMGIVFKALDPTLNRFVAIKVLAPQLATSASARKRFAREARAAAAVSHEHVVPIHAVDEVNGLPYLIMEYIPGQSLQQRIDATGPLEIKEILRIGMQAAAGLAAAHAQGVIHRDIKPANILLENGVERVKITDFGLARTVDDASLTQSGMLAGTPQYMAPEQARGEAQDHRVDLFSLGSVLYALCTGRPPFRANNTMAVLRRVSDDQPTAIREVNPDVPAWLEAIIARLHAKEADERFQTAAELAEVLGQHLARLQQAHGREIADSKLQISDFRPKSPIFNFKSAIHSRWSAMAAALLVVVGGLTVSEATGQTKITKYLATVLRVRTPDGTLLVEVDDPGIDVKVDAENGEIVIHGAGAHEVRLRPGKYQVLASKDGRPVKNELITITQNDKVTVRVSCESDGEVVAGKAFNPPQLGGFTGTVLKDKHDKVVVLQQELQALLSEKATLTGSLPLPSPIGNDQAVPTGTPLPGNPFGGSQPTITPATDPTSPGNPLVQPPSPVGTAPSITALSPRNPFGGNAPAMTPGQILPLVGDHATQTSSPAGAASSIPGMPSTNSFVGKLTTPDPLPASYHLSERPTHIVLSEKLFSLAFSPDGKRLAAAVGKENKSGALYLLDVTTGRVLSQAEEPRPVLSVTFSPDGKLLAAGRADAWTKLIDPATGKTIRVLGGHEGPVNSVAFSPDGKRLATASRDHTIRVWDTISGKEMNGLANATGVPTIAFSADGRMLTGVTDGKIVRTWEMRSGKLLHEQKLEQRLTAVAFSPDGKTVASAGGPQFEVRIWDRDTGKDKKQFWPAHTSPPVGVAFSPDGHYLVTVSGGSNKAGAKSPPEVVVWDVTTGAVLLKVALDQPQVQALAVSPDGKTIALGSADGMVKLWTSQKVLADSIQIGNDHEAVLKRLEAEIKALQAEIHQMRQTNLPARQ